MVWVRLDDGFADHPKVERVGDAGLAMFVRGLCYCNRHLTDGAIPAASVKRLGHQRTAQALVDAGLWTKDGDGFRVHDFGQFNPSREEVLKERARNAERQRKWKDERKRRRAGNASSNTTGNGVSDTVNNAAPPPYPPPPPVLLRSTRGRGGDGACAPEERRAAPGKDNPLRSEAIRLAELCGVHERRASDLIDAHGPEALIAAATEAARKGPDAQAHLLDTLKAHA